MSAQAPDGSREVTVVDARGLRCPLPVIRLARAARDLPPGSVLVLWATDPAARADVPAWCRMRGHELLETTEDDAEPTGPVEPGAEAGHTAYRVRLTTP